MTTEDVPSYRIEEIGDTLETDTPPNPEVVGVVLAGGTSSRFGEANKLLADVDDELLVRHATRTLLRADLSEVVVVVGYEGERIRAVLSDFDVRVVTNPNYADGLSTTVAAGLRPVETANAVVFLPGDMPSVDPMTIHHLIDAYRAGFGTAIAAAYDGHRGNPVLFDRTHFDDLSTLDGDVGGRPVFLASDDSALIAVSDSGVLEDINTLEDL